MNTALIAGHGILPKRLNETQRDTLIIALLHMNAPKQGYSILACGVSNVVFIIAMYFAMRVDKV